MERSAAVAAVFEPVRAATAFEETVERLGTAIRVGLLVAGSRLPSERELADELQISRSTLRQALTALVQSGHLVSRRGRSGGTFVSDSPPLLGAPGEEPLPAETRATLDERVALELGATALAVERSAEADLAPLEEAVERMAAAETFEDYRRADVSFHVGIAAAAHSPRLVTAMTETQGQVSEQIARIAHPEEVLTRSNAQHRRLVGLLRRREAGRALPLMREHIEGTEHILAGLMGPG